MTFQLIVPLYLLTIIFSSSPRVFANSHLERLNFKYTRIVNIGEAQRLDFYSKLKEVLAQDQLFMVKLSDTFHAEVVFFDREYEKAVFVKYGYEVDKKEVYGKIIDLPDGVLVHNKDKLDTGYAIYFEGFKKAEVLPLLNALTFSSASVSRHVRSWPGLDLIIINNAQAQEECIQGPGKIGDLEKVSNWTKSNYAIQKSCVIEAFLRARGPVEEMSSAGKTWEDVHRFWKGIRVFSEDVTNLMKKHSLPGDQKVSVMCSVVTELSSDNLASYVFEGRAVQKTLESIEAAMIKK